MATELQAAEVKVRIETEEAVRQIDAIEREQMRRTNSRRPGPDPNVQRPDMGASAATGDRESAPIPATTDGRSNTVPPPLPAADDALTRPRPSITPAIESAAASNANEAANIASRAAQFVQSPVSALGQELSAAATNAFPAAMPYLGAAGALAAYVPIAASVGPSVTGFVEGAFGEGPLGKIIGILLGTGVGVGGREVAEAYNQIASRIGAVGDLTKQISDIGFAQARLMGEPDPAFLRGIAVPLYQADQRFNFESRMAESTRGYYGGRALGQAVGESWDAFIRGGAH